MASSMPLGNTVNRVKILKEGETTTHEVFVRKLHKGIGPAPDVKNKAMYIKDLLGGLYRTNLDASSEKVSLPGFRNCDRHCDSTLGLGPTELNKYLLP